MFTIWAFTINIVYLYYSLYRDLVVLIHLEPVLKKNNLIQLSL